MKTLLTITLLFLSTVSFADSTTNCWSDSLGNIHCTTVESPSGSITPSW